MKYNRQQDIQHLLRDRPEGAQKVSSEGMLLGHRLRGRLPSFDPQNPVTP